MLDIPDAYDRATDTPAFSNHTQWEIWAYNNCYQCSNDDMGSAPEGTFCPLITVALMGRTPAEWSDQDPPLGDYLCIYFRDGDDGDGGREPEPVPDPPGQEILFPREPWEGRRLWLTPETVALSRDPAMLG